MLRENTSELGLGGGILESAGSPAPAVVTEVRPAWSPAKRVAFRFLFSYLFLYIFPFPLDYVPFLSKALEGYQKLWDGLVKWVGPKVFHVAVTAEPNGSGDTTWNYVQLFCLLALALAATAVWSVLDRRRTQYARLHEWLRVYVRLSLAGAMLSYGAFKVIKSQFPAPSWDRLLQPYGESSPMRLLWNFMGASKAYTIFGGLSEVIGGALLAFRRTTLLGALVSIAVMSNVVMLNFSYDVPVKLYSSHLLAMALFLAAPDLRRLLSFFVLNRPVEAAPDRPLFERKGLHRGALALRTALILYIFGFALNLSYHQAQEYGDLAPRSPLDGVWNVEEQTVDGQVRPPLLTDDVRWRRVLFSAKDRMAVQLMTDARQGFSVQLDPAKRTMALTRFGEKKPASVLNYQEPGPGLLVLEGTYGGKKVQAKLRKADPKKFQLVSRGFHWISEYPFNR